MHNLDHQYTKYVEWGHGNIRDLFGHKQHIWIWNEQVWETYHMYIILVLVKQYWTNIQAYNFWVDLCVCAMYVWTGFDILVESHWVLQNTNMNLYWKQADPYIKLVTKLYLRIRYRLSQDYIRTQQVGPPKTHDRICFDFTWTQQVGPPKISKNLQEDSKKWVRKFFSQINIEFKENENFKTFYVMHDSDLKYT
jgi:hypothetical protein